MQKKTAFLHWITENINILPLAEKIQVLTIISNNLGIDKIVESSDGSRIIINDLSQESIDLILHIFIPYINNVI